jgi:hypothetical protein
MHGKVSILEVSMLEALMLNVPMLNVLMLEVPMLEAPNCEKYKGSSKLDYSSVLMTIRDLDKLTLF